MKIYELFFTGTEQLLKPLTINTLPSDVKLKGYNNNNEPYYYSELTGQFYLVIV